jgi:hypothetical protein
VLIGAGTPREAAARGLADLFFIHAEDAGAIILGVASPTLDDDLGLALRV